MGEFCPSRAIAVFNASKGFVVFQHHAIADKRWINKLGIELNHHLTGDQLCFQFFGRIGFGGEIVDAPAEIAGRAETGKIRQPRSSHCRRVRNRRFVFR